MPADSDPEVRRLSATIAANARAAKQSARAMTAPARAAFMQKFMDEADPNHELDELERMRRGEHLLRAHMARLALRRHKRDRADEVVGPTTRQTEPPVAHAYRVMAKAGYRPAAPSDGLGNITGPLNLRREIADYCADWAEQEESASYFIGTGDYTTMVPFVLLIEASRLLCGGALVNKLGLKLVRIAAGQLEEILG